VLIVGLLRTTRRTDALERELERLRRRVEGIDSVAPTGPTATPATPRSATQPWKVAAASDTVSNPPAPGPTVMPHSSSAVVAAEALADVPADTRNPFTSGTEAPERSVEQLVGGVWLQNAGSVLLLVGFFFLILWGYATGRLGPGVLVGAGVLAGVGLVWRGDRMRRSVRGIGHALIGVGAGVVWLALYLGHFNLHALSTPVAFVFVALASVLTGVLGLHYRVQIIAALGLVGGFLPNAIRPLMPEFGFALPAGGLLGYLALLNALVLALAARAGWSGIALASLLMSAGTWIAAVPARGWSWPLEVGLAALFAGLGLAPVPRLTRIDGTVRPIDLAVIAIAPLALLAVSAPMFQMARPVHVAIMLLILALIYMGVALAVDARRPERDLWRPLSAAAVLFLTAAVERAVGTERTPLAWTVEGVLLLLLGLRPNAGWLRLCGHVVVGFGVMGLLSRIAVGYAGHPLPLVNPDAIRDGLSIAALLFGVHRLVRARESLGEGERAFVWCWFLGAQFMLMLWVAREAHHLAWALERETGAWFRSSHGRLDAVRYRDLWSALTGLVWMAQAAWLAWWGTRRGHSVARAAGYAGAFFASSVPILVVLTGDGWDTDLAPLIHRDALLGLMTIALAVVTSAFLARQRAALHRIERRVSEAWAAGAAVLGLVWISREADHMARVILHVPPASQELSIGASRAAAHALALAAMLTSVGWLVLAIAIFVAGWIERSAFLRWMALVLVGITVLKFLFVDLANADPFWRFFTAIAAGAAMMALSYVYQRLGVRAARPPAGTTGD
jgi:uncharacterized membrane protein